MPQEILETSNDSMDVEFDSNDVENANNTIEGDSSEKETMPVIMQSKGQGDHHIDPMYGTMAPMGAFGDQIETAEESIEVEVDSKDVENENETFATSEATSRVSDVELLKVTFIDYKNNRFPIYV